MSYFVAILHMVDIEKSKEIRPDHLGYLNKLEKEQKIFAKGPFADGTGGLVVYNADSYDEAMTLAENDPYIVHHARRLELKEWSIIE
ncbi:YciI family protein [Cytobacillus kochii]|uniref:YciI family protein n=1 Tax=Cytobacillus kochii TaxID=859143 RepID=UPI0025A17BF5|nr:YciI family protein [Cytobacillus kochii]MDM5206379.1 YciI family protein [Cytobacillus kochii]